MAATPLVHLTLPDITDPSGEGDPAHFAPFQILLEAMCRINEWHIARANKKAAKGEGLPLLPLYASGVRYREDPPGHEDWRDIYQVYASGFGDCDCLVGIRVGELRVAGIPCEPVLKWQWIPRAVMIKLYGAKATQKMIGSGPGVWMVHCLVRYLDGRLDDIEDPSKILGMGGSFTSKV